MYIHAASFLCSRSGDSSTVAAVKRGMLRNVYVIIDMSRGMADTDFRPNRAAVVQTAVLVRRTRTSPACLLPTPSLLPPSPPLQSFIREFFDQNPISCLGMIAVCDGRVQRYSDLSCNVRRHEDAVLAVGKLVPEGDLSLQLALELAAKSLALVPGYATREVVVVQGSHTTNDAGNILTTITECAAQRTRVSVVCLPGEVYVSSRAARDTGGMFVVPETAEALRQALLAHCIPPPLPAVPTSATASTAVVMGFPTIVWDSPGLCACHELVQAHGYLCPRCSSRSCELPAACAVCRLQLVSAASLARSYHHLFPVPPFTPTLHVADAGATDVSVSCAGCGMPVQAMAAVSTGMASAAPPPQRAIEGGGGIDGGAGAGVPTIAVTVNVCPGCGGGYCDSCDLVIHETLHSCPGCVVVAR